MLSRLLNRCCLAALLLAPLAAAGQQLITNGTFAAGSGATTATGWVRVQSGLSRLEFRPTTYNPPNITSTPATNPLNAGGVSLPNRQAFFWKNNTGAVTTATLSQSFVVPLSVGSANLSFVYAFQQAGAGGTLSVSLLNASNVVVATALTQAGLVGATGTGTLNFDVTSLFRANPGATFTLRFLSSQLAGANYLNFAFDNVGLLVTPYVPTGGSGSAASPSQHASRVAQQQAERRLQQQLQANQRRIAREAVARQHRRNQQR